MADFVARNIIQTPDFGKMSQDYLQRARQEEADKNAFLDDFEQKGGLYLEGDKAAVQDSWNMVQSTMDMVAEDDTPEMRRKLKKVYGDYVQVAGAAQVLASQYRNEVASYKSNPSKFSISGQDFVDMSNDFRLRKRNPNDIFAAVDAPFTIPRSTKYGILNPYEQAKALLSESRMKLPDFYTADGVLNKSQLRQWANERARAQVVSDPDNLDKAAIYGARSDGWPEVNSVEDYNFFKKQPEDKYNSWVDSYVDEVVEDYISLVPARLRDSKSTSGKKKKPLATFSDVIVAAERVKEDGKIVEVPGTEISADFIPLPQKVDGISAIGVGNDGAYYVQIPRTIEVEDYRGGNLTKRKEQETIVRKATDQEVVKIINKYGDTYDLSPIFGNSVSSRGGANQDFDLDEFLEENNI